MQTITAACNFYQECNALPGWLENVSQFADNIFLLHTGPGGKKSTDGSIEIAEKWGARLEFDSIDGGYGKVRSKLIHECKGDYVFIMDADERFYKLAPMLECTGQPTPQKVVDAILQSYDNRDDKLPSNWENLKNLGLDLRVEEIGMYDQGRFLREILDNMRPDMVCGIRRHWHDFSWKRPTQSWHELPDIQWRIIKNDPKIGFDPNKGMHESLQGFDHGKVYYPDPNMGPFYDHYHLHFKRQEPEQRREDLRTYDAIAAGQAVPA